MLIETLILGAAFSLLRKGKLSRLSQLVLREFWLVPLALLIQSGVYWAAVRGAEIGLSWFSPVLDTVSYFLLLIFAVRNILLPGMHWLTLGILLNTLVIATNGGVMPVDPLFLPETSRHALLGGQGTHGLMTVATHLSFLADRFYLDILGLRKQVFSIGDLLIDIGSFLLVFRTMTNKLDKTNHRIIGMNLNN
ncbi:DUF5317 domain-containing protein [Desulfosporosinus sp. Sb-LF]|uniref:DUF5317 domain-containing protein n=1 Tax=Desulfosporosinus sp. Sb-LF TaxID=2560027 RepID=UPI00107F245B|nr:DUF5317 domain-containing protein [Desulfosporosinus sp. Sb-LF]TGE33852.1 hypothetical protein E4K68_03265 [Desulfosporosinus sp. Sb-LF]